MMEPVYITGIFLAFALIHSSFASNAVKRLYVKVFGAQAVKGLYRITYTVFSILITGAAIYLVTLLPDLPLIKVEGPLRWAMRGVQVLGIIIGYQAFRAFKLKEFIGTSQIDKYYNKHTIGGDTEGLSEGTLITSGIFGVVRNPLYLAGILLMTFSPDITRNWLTVTVLADIYFIFGSVIEEKRMQMRFGSTYEAYSRQVPLLVPSPARLLRLVLKK